MTVRRVFLGTGDRVDFTVTEAAMIAVGRVMSEEVKRGPVDTLEVLLTVNMTTHVGGMAPHVEAESLPRGHTKGRFSESQGG